MENDAAPQHELVRTLTRMQRRVLGVLVEKGITTPEYYPLTLKAVTAGCNQKSNRDPVASYEEEAVYEVLDQLRELGLVLVVHTESGRTERFRHQVRHHYPFSEPQIAIVTELLLRGRQSMGELRTRASRMVPIDSLEQLRDELRGLIDTGFARASDDLERRGVEVDHGFYPPNERQEGFAARPAAEAPTVPAPASNPTTAPAANTRDDTRLESAIERLQSENRDLRERLDSITEDFRRLEDRFETLRQDLGG